MVQLLPSAALEVLQRRKQYFKTAFAIASPSGCRAPRCVGAGLLDGDALAVETDLAVLLVVAALERWLAGAEMKAVITKV
ncbi:hypothetical protein OG963_00235 [Streptomyces sp. NBC_01707]|uniref:hypothetical protein n=1 Tax=unclassified Streptomyces TaxID=2593676 RepID=UPI002E120B26